MPSPSNNRKIVRVALVLIIGSLVAGHFLAGSIRHHASPAIATEIHAAGQWQALADNRLRIATYNIRRGKGLDDRKDLTRTAEVLALPSAKVIALNEVAGPGLWATPDQAESLGKMLGMGWLFAPTSTRWYRAHFGNALLSSLPVGRWHSAPLIWSDRFNAKEDQSNSHRNLLSVHYSFPGREVVVLITHLDRGSIRATQLDYVLREFLSHKTAILVGDLNTTGDDPLLKQLFKDSETIDAIAAVLPNESNASRIDWVISRGLVPVHGGMHPVGVSDHPMYWVEFEVPSDP